MGKPMRSRILGIVLALSLLAVVFPALNTSAAVHYTGSVVTTDNTGAPKDLFFRGDPVYVNVELKYDGAYYDGQIRVELQRTTDGAVVSWFNDRTNDPETGHFNSSTAWPWPVSLSTGAWFDGMAMVYDVVVYYTGGGAWDEIARTQVTVKNVGLWMDPASSPYYPGERVTITLVTTYQYDVLYAEIVNETGVSKVNWTGIVATDGWWSTVWTIPGDFPDGDFTLNVRDSGTHAIRHHTHFSVQKYMLVLSPDRNSYLPTETAEIAYAVFDVETMTPYSGVQITYSATYFDVSGNQTWINSTLPGSDGVQEFVIPGDINLSSDVVITYWANETSTSRSYETSITLFTGELMATLSLDSNYYLPGQTVIVTVLAMVSWEALPGAEVNIAVERNGTAIAAYGATGLVTDLNGAVTHTFRLDPDAVASTYIVNVTVSKAGVSVTRMTVFNVDLSGELVVSFDKEHYYSGDVVGLRFRTIWNNAEVTDYPVSYMVYATSGLMTTGSTNGTEASFTLPASFYGSLEVRAVVNVDGYMLWDSINTYVNFASIVLTTAQDHYRQGDTLVFSYQILTSVETASLEWEILDADDIRVAGDAPAFTTSGSFAYQVPDTNPSDEYTAVMTMKTPAGGYLTGSVTVTIMQDYELRIWVGKSSYVSGEYKPGQTVTIHYSINTYTYEDLPVYRIVVSNSWDPTALTFLVTEPQGDLEFTIPEDAPTSWMYVSVDLYDGVDGSWLSDDDTMFMVNNRLSAWDKSIGGMSAINLTLLILIVIMILLLIIVPFLKGRMGAPKAPEVKTVEPQPPAPPPSTP